METRTEPIAWEGVLVRHVVAAKRGTVDRLSSLVRVPFPTSSTALFDSGQGELSTLDPCFDRWMIAVQFAKDSWIPLSSNAASGRELFEANADSRRLEVAWAGYQPDGDGWFFRLHRAGKPIVEFAQSAESGSTPMLRSALIAPGLLDGCMTGEVAFQRLCASLEIPLPLRRVHATERGFVVLDARGKPVKTRVRDFLIVRGPEIAEGENAASDALARAIEGCDAEGIREAIERGASLNSLPDTSVSPLLSALYKHGRCDQQSWEACLELLVANGCPIEGRPGDSPPIVDCVQHFVPEHSALRMVEFLLAQGADVNATNSIQETALFESVVYRRMNLVRFLRRHGADPHIRTSQGRSTIEWLRWTLSDRYGSPEEAIYDEILTLLTGSSDE